MKLVLMTPSLHMSLFMLIIRGMCATASINLVFDYSCIKEALINSSIQPLGRF